MSNTVASTVSLTKNTPVLAGIPRQPVPFAPSAEQLPRTWVFTNRYTGQPVEVTCMPGCVLDHTLDTEGVTMPEDIHCETDSARAMVTLPMNTGKGIEELPVLGISLRVDPFSRTVAGRLPFADLAIAEDRVIEALDPDGLATVLNTIAARLGTLWEEHARLVQIRAEYLARLA